MSSFESSKCNACSRLIAEMEKMLPDDVKVNKTMGDHGAQHILNFYKDKPVKVLTHCNAGALATAGYGTALGRLCKSWINIMLHVV